MKGLVFGIPALMELSDIESHAALCTQLGFSFVELNMNFPIFQIQALDIRKYSRIKEESGIFYTLHLDECFDVGSFNKLVNRAWKDTALQSIVLAKQLKIPIINMHLADGIYVTLPEERVSLYARHRDEYLKNILNFRNLCEQAIACDDITICVENNGSFRKDQQEAIDLLLESKAFGLTFDMGHDYVCGGANENFIMTRKNRLRHMHIHDAAGKQNHMALGTGDLDIKDRLRIAQAQNCRCVLETKTAAALKTSAQYLEALHDHR